MLPHLVAIAFPIALIFTITLDEGVDKKPRNQKQRTLFISQNPCPVTGLIQKKCEGYHVDHVVPLACGGKDLVFNMQWLTAHENLSKGSMGCKYKIN